MKTQVIQRNFYKLPGKKNNHIKNRKNDLWFLSLIAIPGAITQQRNILKFLKIFFKIEVYSQQIVKIFSVVLKQERNKEKSYLQFTLLKKKKKNKVRKLLEKGVLSLWERKPGNKTEYDYGNRGVSKVAGQKIPCGDVKRSVHNDSYSSGLKFYFLD